MLASRLLLYNVVEFATCTYVSEGINITNGEEEEVFLKDTDNIAKKNTDVQFSATHMMSSM